MPSRTTLEWSWVVLVRAPAVVVTALTLLSVSTPRELQGQSWRSVNALGYGGAGAAVAISLVDVDDCTDEGLGCLLLEIPLLIASGGVAGSIIGELIGRGADRSLAVGKPLGDLHLAAVAGGTVLAGATAGVLVAGTVVSELSPDASLAAFRQSALILSIAGAVVGIAYVGAHWDELTGEESERIRLTPTYSPGRGPGLVARIGL